MALFDFLRKTKVDFGSNEATLSRASKGYVKDPWFAKSKYQTGEGVPGSVNTNLELYSKDPLVHTAIEARTNAILASGWTIEGAPTPKKAAEKKLEELGFNYAFFDQMLKNYLLYDHVFVEIVRNGKGTPKELHILETTQMNIDYTEHGDIIQFVQKAGEGQEVTFSPKDIVYLARDKVTSNIWGEVSLKTLYRTATTKNYIERFINGLSTTGAWRQVFKTKSMSDDNINNFLAEMANQEANPTDAVVIQMPSSSDDVAKDNVFETLRNPTDLKDFLGVLEYLQSQILMELKVPPILVGLPDNSNRSNSDTQMQAFHISNEADRIKLSNKLKELFEKIGLKGIEFSWNPIDKRNAKDDVEIAEKLMNMGAKREQIEKFLRSAGVELPEGEFFDEKEDPMDMMMAKEEMKTPDDAASRPSRQRTGDDKQESIGTGKESSTRQDQL